MPVTDQAEFGGATQAEADALLNDGRLTALGLIIETYNGLFSAYAPDLERFGFSQSSFEVLLRLARSPLYQLRMAELTAQCTLTSSGLTRVVDRLEAAGLVIRRPCPTDRRGYYATLTPDGQTALIRALPSHLAIIERTLTSILEPHELEAFLAALRKIRAVVQPGSDPSLAATVANGSELVSAPTQQSSHTDRAAGS